MIFFFIKSLASKLEIKRAMIASKNEKINDLSRNSSLNKSNIKRESLNNNRRDSSHYQIGLDGKSFYKTKFNDSLWDNSKMKIHNNNEMNDLFNLNINNIKKRSKVLDDSNFLMSRVFQNSSSLSISTPNNSQNNISYNNNNYNIFINRSSKNANQYYRSYKENNKDIEILNNNINIITINKNRSCSRNRISLLRKLDTNLNNIKIKNMEKKSNNENNENIENNNNITDNNNINIKTTEIKLNNDASQYKK